jgi:hypothetical protein
MVERVISGGQTGVDLAALRAARAAGIATGGTAPKGWATEAGPDPGLADFGLVECGSPGYALRTIRNARESDGTLWIGDPDSPGGRLTIATVGVAGLPLMIVREGSTTPADVHRWIEAEGIRTLNIAGNRESTEPRIGAGAEEFLATVFRRAPQPGSDG